MPASPAQPPRAQHSPPRPGAASQQAPNPVATAAGLATALALLLAGVSGLTGDDPAPSGPASATAHRQHPAAEGPNGSQASHPPLAVPGGAARQPATYVPVLTGHDISWPQCLTGVPGGRRDFAIVGINHGKPLSTNRCLRQQWAWAKMHPRTAVYLNTAYPPHGGDPYTYGRRIARDSLQRAADERVSAQVWWLDVETANTWAGTPQQHRRVLQGVADELVSAGKRIGVYSAPGMWREITDGWQPGWPIWVATGEDNQSSALSECQSGIDAPAAIVQWVQVAENGKSLDYNAVCPGWKNLTEQLFAAP